MMGGGTMKMKKVSIILIVAVFTVFSTLTFSLFTSENASAHAPAALYPTYKEGTLTVYIDHQSDEPTTHYIETVTITVNRVELLSETYTSQTVDEKGKGMVTYSYTVTASDGDVISVTADCSIDGSITEFLTVGEGDSKDDPKDDPKDYPDKDNYTKDDPKRDDPSKDGDSDQANNTTLLLSGAIVGMVVIIIALVAVLRDWGKGRTRKDTTRKDTTRKDTTRKNKINKDDWTTCPECGSSLRMGRLHSHLDKVHPEMSKSAKEKMIERITK
jgi:hypothetical protein